MASATDEQRQAMDRFLAGVEQRAYAMTVMTTKNADDALDVIQDAMMILAFRYYQRPESEWPPLFFRILRNKTTDFVRRRNIKVRLFGLFGSRNDDDVETQDPVATLRTAIGDSPEAQYALSGVRAELIEAIATLPDRQRNAFLLREVEGFDHLLPPCPRGIRGTPCLAMLPQSGARPLSAPPAQLSPIEVV